MTFSDRDWLRILSQLGVQPTTAAEWAGPFADEVQPERFSAGMADLQDFLPQILHEYGMLEKREEDLYYSADRLCAVWPGRFPSLQDALPYAHNPVALANKVYGGRMGNTDPGDGWRFRGRPMLTGRGTYARVGDRIGQDLTVMPELIEQPHFALIAAAGWWEGDIPDVILNDQAKIRRRVQGGALGLEHCAELAQKTREVFA